MQDLDTSPFSFSAPCFWNSLSVEVSLDSLRFFDVSSLFSFASLLSPRSYLFWLVISLRYGAFHPAFTRDSLALFSVDLLFLVTFHCFHVYMFVRVCSFGSSNSLSLSRVVPQTFVITSICLSVCSRSSITRTTSPRCAGMRSNFRHNARCIRQNSNN